jgi:hypothetical protein
MSEEVPDEPDEPDSVDDQTDESGDVDPADSPPRRSSARGSRGRSRAQQQFEKSIARNLLSQTELLRAQQRLTENFLRSVGGIDSLQKQLLGVAPQVDAFRAQQVQLGESIARNVLSQTEVVRAQQRLTENLLQSVGGIDGFHNQLLPLLPQIEAFRRFAKVTIPSLIKLPPPNLPMDWLPPNWEDVDGLDIDEAIGIVLDEGVPLAWAPRPAIVAQLVDASDGGARDEILRSSCDDIADDCAVVLAEIGAPELKPLVDLAVEAVAALRGGYSSGAQALAGNVFDTLLRDATRRGVIFTGPPVGYFKYDKVRKRIIPVSDDTSIGHFRAACVLSAALPALENYDPSDPPPSRFVRHATAHCTHPIQYTPVNAIIAVMLMVSMLREAEASGW